ncbi:LysE family translocator [Photobacterium sanguinicancri]|uniref:LysE family translocator n=1 Tax=Photobacterium sanguinicancri TaxID=875932 RepID=A0ABX4G5A9_9GAMM|nr:LysE family translocator [Photobacterium sanguinicancri]KXI21254.1 threonine transporter RhtB [Photobacterium sanguinicancri]OZS45945.1 LysE family translocator [Photobacterium sanguinicancri]
MEYGVLLVFIPTFFFVSITPGMCMTLALGLGMSIGFRRTLWMMLGEVVGVALVAISAVLGIAAIMIKMPWLFVVFKTIGAMYLAYLGLQMWQSKGKMALSDDKLQTSQASNLGLVAQGFITAIANPKGWAFMISLLPPFIQSDLDFAPQLALLVSIIMISEFVCMSIYASGGKALRRLLMNQQNVKTMNRIAGSMMFGVAIWLLMS